MCQFELFSITTASILTFWCILALLILQHGALWDMSVMGHVWCQYCCCACYHTKFKRCLNDVWVNTMQKGFYSCRNGRYWEAINLAPNLQLEAFEMLFRCGLSMIYQTLNGTRSFKQTQFNNVRCLFSTISGVMQWKEVVGIGPFKFWYSFFWYYGGHGS
jgi:hypothetical protein